MQGFHWLLLIAAVVAIAPLLIMAPLIPAWIQARAADVRVSPMRLVGMVLRRSEPALILGRAVVLQKAGIPVELAKLEAHKLAGGALRDVVDASVAADKAGLPYGFEALAAIDLAGRDVLGAVIAAVNPKVFRCPADPGSRIRAVSRDGIRISVSVRVTVRSDISRLVGGAGAGTIIARIGEGIVAAIGSTQTHKAVLEQPEIISRYILDHGLDAGTSYEIVSIDIEDVDIEDNVGARLADEQATADKLVSQARSEGRRAMAVAKELEMRARVVEQVSAVVRSEATVPEAVAAALRGGRIWRSPRAVLPTFADRPWDAVELASTQRFR